MNECMHADCFFVAKVGNLFMLKYFRFRMSGVENEDLHCVVGPLAIAILEGGLAQILAPATVVASTAIVDV